jgi:hypothetical protein
LATGTAGAGAFVTNGTISASSNTRYVAVGEFNGDTNPDLAVVNFGDSSVSILTGQGNGNFNASVQYVVGSNPTAVTIGDFNGDGKQDLALTNASSNTISILIGTGTGTFGTKTDYPAPAAYSIANGDFNKDGKIDLAVTDANGVVGIYFWHRHRHLRHQDNLSGGIKPAINRCDRLQ